MILIDLSRDIEHKMAVLPNHPQVIVTAFATHDEVRVAEGYGFSSATMALVKGEQAASVTIKPKDTVLLHMDFFRRSHGTPGFITDFPGLTKESATWLGNKGIGMFGVEAVSPGRPGRNNFEVHHVCRDLGFTHMEGLVNLDKLVGKGRFRFIGFPIKIKGGTGAPIRAVAWLDG